MVHICYYHLKNQAKFLTNLLSNYRYPILSRYYSLMVLLKLDSS